MQGETLGQDAPRTPRLRLARTLVVGCALSAVLNLLAVRSYALFNRYSGL